MRRSNARKPVDSGASNDMDPIKLPMRPAARSNLFARGPKHGTRSNFLILASIAVTFVFLLLCYFFVHARSSRGFGNKRYGIIIDGGSTGTRIHVFGFELEGQNAVFDFGNSGSVSMRVNPGLSAYSDDPEAAGGSLTELLAFVKERVPKESWRETDIRLMATAGLRLLDSSVQDRILGSCRRTLRASGFNFRDEWASVITGSEEGMYAWVVANYALGSLGSDPLQTTGIIELGGASAQVTFVSSETMPSEYSRAIKFRNITYNLYSHSFLHFGQNVAYDLLRRALTLGEFNLAKSVQEGLSTDPCTPTGYSHGGESWKLSPGLLNENNKYPSTLPSKGNFSECRSAALMMLQKGKENCSSQHCYIGSTFMPKLQGKFLATENFFHTSKFFGLGQKAFLSDLIMAGQQFCEEDWSKLMKRYHSLHEEDLLHYCFSSAYIVALLHDTFGIALDEERIAVASQVEDIPLDWPLGAFILQTTADLEVHHSYWIVTILGDDLPTLISLIAIFAVLVFTVWSISKWRKPQLKTIYDLEKGRYIVTRIGRHR
ncbi:probable apyrase 6 [Humulus lupulus]|uniref:probable apyrase 6 n=1 Tax=Humulus lupulus TaxID=3486 RepID=UPI002B40F0A6|nr:probable apyrase 6 [Humulus lupulus]